MLAALLAGDGLGAIAELAAEEAGEPVAIVLPARGLAAASGDEVELAGLADAVGAAPAPETPSDAGRPASSRADRGRRRGDRARCSRSRRPRTDAAHVAGRPRGVLRTAALAALAEVAVADARDEVAADIRGSLLEDLRAGRAEPAETMSRAARLGCDLPRGAVALVAEVSSARPATPRR